MWHDPCFASTVRLSACGRTRPCTAGRQAGRPALAEGGGRRPRDGRVMECRHARMPAAPATVALMSSAPAMARRRVPSSWHGSGKYTVTSSAGWKAGGSDPVSGDPHRIRALNRAASVWSRPVSTSKGASATASPSEETDGCHRHDRLAHRHSVSRHEAGPRTGAFGARPQARRRLCRRHLTR
jgi:hypothetical protein